LNRQLKQKVMRFNFFQAEETATQNHEGGLAWEMDVQAEWYAAAYS